MEASTDKDQNQIVADADRGGTTINVHKLLTSRGTSILT